MAKFKLISKFKPCGDQPQAIRELTQGVFEGRKHQTLLGVTGSGKTFTIANVIANIGLPALVISHNKTLAAQLYSEFKEFFPYNRVEYFVSYYDYYQPEAYIPATDTYIEKDASINEELDRLRLSATSSLMAGDDVIIVASVSCIYNLGSPEEYRGLLLFLQKGQDIPRDELLNRLVQIQYERNDLDLSRGKFRVRGEVIEIFPAYEDAALRVEFFGDRIERIAEIDPVTSKNLKNFEKVAVYPAKHFLVSSDKIAQALKSIEWELDDRLRELTAQGKLLEAQRLKSRTRYDMEMLREIGYCHGIENYSRHLSGRPPGSRPYCLIDYFPERFLTVIDESHVTLAQLRGMYEGDRSRKETLVEHGFRLPSCLDNRPLKFEEFEILLDKVIFVSATPQEYEISASGARVVEQVIRPTGLVDPEIIVKPTAGQIEDLIRQIRLRAKAGERILVTTLTKRMAEDLTDYLGQEGLRVRYLHSEIEPIERVKLLKDLRSKKFDCLVGINLLREGLDLPEVSLVAVLDADKEGFLRSEVSLIQVAGRAARNINGQVVLYADHTTESMRRAIVESRRRRQKQLEYNRRHNIKPQTIKKAIRDSIETMQEARELVLKASGQNRRDYDTEELISQLQDEMWLAARNLQFERAVLLRDKIEELKKSYKL
jgi:excinuclease ABC subunit B